MTRAMRWAIRWQLATTVIACAGGEQAPGKDTVPPEPSPAAGRRTGGAPAWTWDRRAGAVFALPGPNGLTARLVQPAWSAEQALDTLLEPDPAANSAALVLMAGATVLGTARVDGVSVDSACAGWPVARLDTPGVSQPLPWRVAFEPGTVDGVAFDSLPQLRAADSALVTREAARAASRLADDTAATFRGRPFVVRQVNRFALDGGTTAQLVEIIRLVPQEANPLQEQLVMIMEPGAPGTGDAREAVFHARSIGLEEAVASVELLAVLRVRQTGRVALLLRRDREGGFLVQWVERIAARRWVVTWQSALDSC